MYGSVFFLAVLGAGAVLAEEGYKTSFPDVNVDEVLGNERLYQRYLECLKGTGKCTPEAKELKGLLPDALSSGCSKCSEKQKAGAEKVIKHMLKNKPVDFEALEKLYDPEGTYKKKFEAEAKKLGIPV